MEKNRNDYVVVSERIDERIPYLFTSENPFFNQGRVKVISYGDDKLTAFSHPEYKYKGKPYICFGYWTFKNKKNSLSCFEDLKKWANENQVDLILGPINFSSFHEYRLPLENYTSFFSGEPTGVLEQSLFLRSINYKVYQKYSTYYIKNPSQIYKWGQKRSEKILRNRSKYKTIQFKDFDFRNRKEELYDLIHNSFKSNPFYIQASDFELALLYSEDALNKLANCPFFLVEDNNKLVGVFMSFVAPNVFEPLASSVLYFKTIGSLPSKELYNPVFFYMIHEIYKSYENLKMDIPISFALMREGNVAEKVAKLFSDEKRTYGLFGLNL